MECHNLSPKLRIHQRGKSILLKTSVAHSSQEGGKRWTSATERKRYYPECVYETPDPYTALGLSKSAQDFR